MGGDFVQAGGETFFYLKSSMACGSCARDGGRPRRELAISPSCARARLTVFLARCDAELLVEPLREIDDPPAHHAMDGTGSGSFVHPPCQGRR